MENAKMSVETELPGRVRAQTHLLQNLCSHISYFQGNAKIQHLANTGQSLPSLVSDATPDL